MNARAALVFLHDTVAAAAAWYGAFLLRFNFSIPDNYLYGMLNTLWIVVPLQSILALRFGLYRGMWRFASLPDLTRILYAVGVAAVLLPALLWMLHRSTDVPRSVLVLDPILLVVAMGLSRFLYRSWKDGHLLSPRELSSAKVLVLGAGGAASSLLRELERSSDWRVVGLLDDDAAKHGLMLQGVKVLGALSDLRYQAARLEVTHAIIAMPSASAAHRRRAAELAAEAGLEVLTVPSIDDLLSGRVSVSQIRRLELEDLIGRERIVLDDAGLHNLLGDHVILVTGAGGSIGSELVRQIARYGPSKLVLFDVSEFSLYQIEQEFEEQYPDVPMVCLVGDIRDAARVNETLERYRPSMVFHAAAYKHVPLMENDNCWEAVRNNVGGTLTLARAAIKHGVGEFVLISTDKAVNPTNVMGASKRLAEMVCQGLQAGSATRFVTVRFGNVLGSSGSVIPKFGEQIARGGPITVTHPEIMRYFMSISEAAQLVLQAGLMGREGEILVLDMGEPVRIVDLARDMIRLSGLSEEDVPIVYTGLRPGEKLYEEPLAVDEETLATPHPKVRVAKARTVERGWLDSLGRWLAQERALPDAEVKRKLAQWVPEYAPSRRPELRAIDGISAKAQDVR